MVKRIATAAALVLTLVPIGGRTAPSSAADAWRLRVSEVAHQAGLDPVDILSSEIALRVPGPVGAPVVRRATVNEWFEYLGGGRMAAGLGGLPETTVGDFLHAYVNVGFGIDPSYEVTTSTIVPATPGVYPPAPANLLLFEAGGPLTQVKGSYAVGLHTVGTALGSNVDTADSGPYLPVANTDLVADSRIDFIGHVDTLTQEGACFVGICLVYIGVLIADGVTFWDTEDPSLPVIP
jgi:hypothetical protein